MTQSVGWENPISLSSTFLIVDTAWHEVLSAEQNFISFDYKIIIKMVPL